MSLQIVSPPSDNIQTLLRKTEPLCLLVDTRIPEIEGVLKTVTQNGFHAPVMFFSSEESARVTLAAAKQLLANASSARDRISVLQEVDKKDAIKLVGLEKIVGNSAAWLNVFKTVEKVADTDSNVLICGESGTGKELIAHLIHENSHRSDHPFIAVDCSALPENLLESELFGFERGAFTDAYQMKHGIFEFADKGTLFLDEAGEMPLQVQTKLLRVLQERQFRRIGGKALIRVDVRIISATNKDLVAAMDEKLFRQDLFYRLNVISLTLPPLRERKEDIPLLANHYLSHFCEVLKKPLKSISQSAMVMMEQYPWPGNVRELKNVIERGAALADGETLNLEDLPPQIRAMEPCGHETLNLTLSFEDAKNRMIDSFEKQYLHALLELCEGNVSLAARKAGVNRKTIHRLLKRLGLESH